ADTWIKKADFPGVARTTAVGFSIGNKGYVGVGDAGGVLKKDFYEYDPTDTTNGFDINHNPLGKWTAKTNFGGTARSDANGFSIGTKGYIGAGEDVGGFKKDFWEYDPLNDSWTAKANLPGVRSTACGFSLNGKGYIGAGDDGANLH